jgi:hypothetical protein
MDKTPTKTSSTSNACLCCDADVSKRSYTKVFGKSGIHQKVESVLGITLHRDSLGNANICQSCSKKYERWSKQIVEQKSKLMNKCEGDRVKRMAHFTPTKHDKRSRAMDGAQTSGTLDAQCTESHVSTNPCNKNYFFNLVHDCI